MRLAGVISLVLFGLVWVSSQPARLTIGGGGGSLPECLAEIRSFKQGVRWVSTGNRFQLRASDACSASRARPFDFQQAELELVDSRGRRTRLKAGEGFIDLKGRLLYLGRFSRVGCFAGLKELSIDLQTGELRAPSGEYWNLSAEADLPCEGSI